MPAAEVVAPGTVGFVSATMGIRVKEYEASSRSHVVSTNGDVRAATPHVLSTAEMASITTVDTAAPMTRYSHISGSARRNVGTAVPSSAPLNP